MWHIDIGVGLAKQHASLHRVVLAFHPLCSSHYTASGSMEPGSNVPSFALKPHSPDPSLIARTRAIMWKSALCVHTNCSHVACMQVCCLPAGAVLTPSLNSHLWPSVIQTSQVVFQHKHGRSLQFCSDVSTCAFVTKCFVCMSLRNSNTRRKVKVTAASGSLKHLAGRGISVDSTITYVLKKTFASLCLWLAQCDTTTCNFRMVRRIIDKQLCDRYTATVMGWQWKFCSSARPAAEQLRHSG